MPDNTMDFLISLFPGNEFLDNAKTIPNNEPTDVPKITPASICPLFCHTLYPSYLTQNSGVSSSSPEANRC